jgi:hypothetical protein
MKTLLVLMLAAAVQQPPIQNGRVETRQASSIASEVQTIAKAATDPVWVAWRVPMIDGDRDLCSWYSDDNYAVRGFFAEPRTMGSPQQKITPPTGAVPIEAGTALVVLLRLSEGKVERMRKLTADCPIDAGGRTIYWLNGIAPSESIKYLETLTLDHPESGLENMLSAIALHRDPAADATLDRIATSDTSTSRRRQAISLLGSYRGAHGFATLRQLLERETSSELRRALVSSIGRTSQPETVNVLRTLLHDPDAKVRADAVYYFAQRGRAAVVSDVLKVIDADADASVKKRAIAGLAAAPNEENLPTLIQLAKTHANADVRKEAFSRVSQSRDPRAIAMMQEILKK